MVQRRVLRDQPPESVEQAVPLCFDRNSQSQGAGLRGIGERAGLVRTGDDGVELLCSILAWIAIGRRRPNGRPWLGAPPGPRCPLAGQSGGGVSRSVQRTINAVLAAPAYPKISCRRRLPSHGTGRSSLSNPAAINNGLWARFWKRTWMSRSPMATSATASTKSRKICWDLAVA